MKRENVVVGISLGIQDLEDQMQALHIEYDHSDCANEKEALLEDIEDVGNQLNTLMNMQEW